MAEDKREKELKSALNQLKENLEKLGQQAWESPQRRQIQNDLESMLKELEANLQQAGQEFRQSDAGQQLKQEVERIKEQFDSGELERKAKLELVKLVGQLNEHLENWLSSDDSAAQTSGMVDEGMGADGAS